MRFGVITLFLKEVVNMVNSGILAQIFEEASINESDLMVFAGIMLVYFAILPLLRADFPLCIKKQTAGF